MYTGTSAGRKPEFSWTDAREAADRLFAELPAKVRHSKISSLSLISIVSAQQLTSETTVGSGKRDFFW